MPRFYFDTDEGNRQFRDEAGIELASADDVPEQAMALLRDLMHEHLPVGSLVMSTNIRDTTGKLVYRATLTVVGKRFD